MTKRIYKYPFGILDRCMVDLPENHEIIHIGLDPNHQPCIWAKVDPVEIDVSTEICVIGTGHDVDDGMEHIGSFVDGQFVWHVFKKS